MARCHGHKETPTATNSNAAAAMGVLDFTVSQRQPTVMLWRRMDVLRVSAATYSYSPLSESMVRMIWKYSSQAKSMKAIAKVEMNVPRIAWDAKVYRGPNPQTQTAKGRGRVEQGSQDGTRPCAILGFAWREQ